MQRGERAGSGGGQAPEQAASWRRARWDPGADAQAVSELQAATAHLVGSTAAGSAAEAHTQHGKDAWRPADPCCGTQGRCRG